jgi:hypothetical protein
LAQQLRRHQRHARTSAAKARMLLYKHRRDEDAHQRMLEDEEEARLLQAKKREIGLATAEAEEQKELERERKESNYCLRLLLINSFHYHVIPSHMLL